MNDKEVDIMFMQSVELIYLNDDALIAGDSREEELGQRLAKYIKTAILMDDRYDGKGIMVDMGNRCDRADAEEIRYFYDRTAGGIVIETKGTRHFIDGAYISTDKLDFMQTMQTMDREKLRPDLFIHKCGTDAENLIAVMVKKDIDLNKEDRVRDMVRDMVTLSVFTRDETGEQKGIFALGLYIGFHAEYCNVFIFKNGNIESPFYRFEKNTGIWKKLQPGTNETAAAI